MDAAVKWRLAGLVPGLAAAYTLPHTYAYWLGVPVLAACLWLGVLVGELTLSRPERLGPRTAVLEVRHVRDYLPQPAVRGVLALTLGLVVVLVVGAVVSGPPIFHWYRLPDVAAGDWTGWGVFEYFSADSWTGALVAGLTIAGSLGFGWLLVRQVVRAPRAGVDAERFRLDEAWRRRTAQTITAACGVLVSAAMAGILFLAADWAGRFLTSLAFALAGSVALLAFAGYTAMLMHPAPDSETAPAPAQPAPAQPAPGSDASAAALR